MLNDYKSQLETEILSGMCFDEDYNVDSNEHFALAPQDVVKIDLRDYLKKVVADIKAARHAKYGEVEVDEVTGKVSVKGQPAQSSVGSGVVPSAGDTTAGTDSRDSESSVDKSSRNDVVEFMKMLKKNGALDKLKGLGPETKKKMADAVLAAIKNPAAPASSAAKTTPKQKPLKQPAKQKNKDFDQRDPNAPDQRQMDRNEPEFEESLTLKEAYIILTEGLVDELDAKKGTGKKPVAPLTTTPATPAPPSSAAPVASAPVASASAPAAPAAPSTPPAATPATPTAAGATKLDVNSAKLADVAKNPGSFGVKPDDPKIVYLKKLEADYDHISKIPNVENSEVLAAVENVSDQNGTVDVQILQKKSSGADGKSQYGESGKSFTIPQNTIKRRTPVEQIKKKGLFAKFFGG